MTVFCSAQPYIPTFERPGLAEMIDFTRKGDTICVVRLDRLGRSLKELLKTVERFRDEGLEFRR